MYNLRVFKEFFIDADYCPLRGMYNWGLTHKPEIFML